ncbi:protein of unknown function [Polaribacter sp. KT25b]|uniref:DUF3857 domain-containing protein n=1 Tax=Polaribacter sp. KT25b TaxID=1855336 RepID=UPI00087BF876|nr:DUF3857 domain-containing protein [Polaribacter sp. KT25b]SDS02528.1 protein of unknown function [Polaribacter sp. KT25b]
MGQTTLDELKMTIYDKDSTATAVVLYEHANIYIDVNNDYNTRTDFYFRIKILDKTAFDLANISIHLFKKKRLLDVKARTYNLTEIGTIEKIALSEDKIYTKDASENWTTKNFTLPNIKVGSVIEYSYSIISPYLGIDDWLFQSDIPKIKSEFDAAILGNYKYKIRITGYLKLDKDDVSVKKKCIYIQGLGEGDCAIYSYGIDDIPAFEEEDYMLSKKNYLSRLSFDLETYTSSRGVIENYTTTWKEADKKLKKIFLNNQTSKKSFFKKNIPEEILNIKDDLEKAKSIYTFIQNRFTWNEEYWNDQDEKIKQAFNDKSGSAGEINLSLYNSLKVAKINANLIILSTRNNGIPTTLFPVIFDFNYVIVKTVINGVDYYLDATNKYLPFGQIPERCLNGKARLIDYSGESNWVELKPKMSSLKNITAILNLNEDGFLDGELKIRSLGYEASKKREKINLLTEDSYLEAFEGDNSDVEVEDYKVNFKDELEKPLQEFFKIKMFLDNELANKIRINPFFFDRLKRNPFKLKERNYPVDFGYPRKNNFALSITIPDNYKITKIPESVAFSLPNNGGLFVLRSKVVKNKITLYVRMSINKQIYSTDEYFALKDFFNQIISAEKSVIILEKKI